MILYSIGIIDDVSIYQLGALGAYPEICPWCARSAVHQYSVRFITDRCAAFISLRAGKVGKRGGAGNRERETHPIGVGLGHAASHARSRGVAG
eukprot:scaffold1611_cov135-Isochrysis_galbana.AAC.1